MTMLSALPVLPTPDLERTAAWYVATLGFRRADYLSAAEPHVCLYRDGAELILTKAKTAVVANHARHGYGYDAYLITSEPTSLQAEFLARGTNIVRAVATTDYGNREFVVEDIDGRWLGFGVKQKRGDSP